MNVLCRTGLDWTGNNFFKNILIIKQALAHEVEYIIRYSLEYIAEYMVLHRAQFILP